MKKISIIIPCYRSEKTIHTVVDEIRLLMLNHNDYSYEIILINDNSPDDVYLVLKGLASEDSGIKVIDLSRNFGQHAAIMSGFSFVTGDIVVCLDDDGQTPADEMFLLIDELNKGFDLVYANYTIKKHNHFRNFGTILNNLMAELLIDKPRGVIMTSYFAARRYVIDEAVKYQNAFPYVGGLLFRVTQNTSRVYVKHRNRIEGESGYRFKSLMSLWLNGFTAFSVKPLRIASFVGFIFALSGFIFGLTVILNRLTNPNTPLGYSSLISAIIFIGGMIMIMLGLIGEYIGRIYISINQSPQYVIKEKINVDK